MTMTLYTGVPGSGKSLHMARVVRNRLRSGWPVVGNFSINPATRGVEHYKYLPNSELRPQPLYDLADAYWHGRPVREGRLMLVVDEAQLVFNARDWGRGDRMEWLEFLSQHRHYGYDVILVTQFDRMLDRQVRSLAEYRVIHRKLSGYGWRGRLACLLACGQLFIAVTTYYSLGDRVSVDVWRYSRRLASLYDSYGRFERVPAKGSR